MDKVEIANMALARIGISTIDSLDEASEPARLCNQFYDQARKVTLRKFPWKFAVRRVQLALLDLTPKDYLYAYRYPANCLCLRKIYNYDFSGLARDNEYMLLSDTAGRVLYTNVPSAYAEYTANVEDCNLFDEQFVEALSWKLAGEIAFKLTGNNNVTEMCVQAYNAFFQDALADDANEQNVKDARLYSLAEARFNDLEV